MLDSSYKYSDANKPVNIRLFFAKYLRYWYLFVIALSITMISAYFYLRAVTPTYLISAEILIEKDNKSTAGETMIGGNKPNTDEKNIENEIEKIKSRSLIERVIDELNLTVAYFQNDGTQNRKEMYEISPIRVTNIDLSSVAYQSPLSVHILNPKQYELINKDDQKNGPYLFNQTVRNDYGKFTISLIDSLYTPATNVINIAFYDKQSLIQQYQSSIKVDLVTLKSTVLKISLESTSPEKGKAVLNQLLSTYRYVSLSDKNQEANSTLKFIDERLRLITGELSNVEKNVESYKSVEGITDLSAEGNLFLQAVKDNDTKLNDIDIQLKVLDGVDKYLRSSIDGVAPATLMVNDPVLTGLLTKLSSSNMEAEKYGRTTQPDNPYRQTVDAQVANTKSAIRDYVANQRQNLLVTRSSLKQLNSRFSSSMRTIPHKEREFLNIKRQQALKESLYLLLLQKKEETAISYASTLTDSHIIDYPYSSPYPIKPNRSSIYLLAFFAGLLIPVGIVSGRNLLNDKVQSRREIENETGMPIFGEITKNPKRSKNNIVELNKDTIIAEQFKILRANLQYGPSLEDGNEGHTILITSSISGEGKSFVSINLALSLALLNKKTIVLELDLRKPQIAQYLDMASDTRKGISNYLADHAVYADLIQQTTLHPDLYFIPSGPVPSNPTELLSNGCIQVLLDQLREQFDYIILDTPPVSMLADTTLLSPYVDTAFYVVRHEYTPRNYLPFLSDLNESQKFKSLHVLVNAVNYTNSEDFGYGYNYAKRKVY